MQVFSCWAVELSLCGLDIDLNSWFSAGGIEPVGDICACSVDERGGVGIANILLDDICEVVDLSEEYDPAVVGSVVVGDLFDGVVSLFGGFDGKVLFEI